MESKRKVPQTRKEGPAASIHCPDRKGESTARRMARSNINYRENNNGENIDSLTGLIGRKTREGRIEGGRLVGGERGQQGPALRESKMDPP